MKKKASVLSLAVLMVVVGLLPAMAAAEAPSAQGFQSKALWKEWVQHKKIWEGSGIDSYVFTQLNTCFCVYGELQIRVQNNVVVSVKDVSTGTFLNPIYFANYTIDAYFETIRQAIIQAEIVNVQYDASYGYPSQVYIDWSSMIADEETSFTITSFQPL